MRKHLLYILSALALSAHAQNERGLWCGADVDAALSARWDMEASVGARLEDDWSRVTRYDASLGFDFKAARWLKFGVGYDFIRDYSPAEELTVAYKKDPDSPDGIKHNSNGNPVVSGFNSADAYWRTKHRLFFDATAKWKVGRFAFSLRERYQWTHSMPVDAVSYKYRDELEEDDLEGYGKPYAGPYYDEYNDPYWYGLERVGDKAAKDKHFLRSRLAVEYNIRHCPVTPFVNYEMANDLGDAFGFVRHRAQLGADIRVSSNKRNYLSVSYLYQHGAREESGTNDLHVLSLSYKYKFSSQRAKAAKKDKKKNKK